MDKRELEVGDIVQLDPDNNGQFGGQFLVVTEPKSWGCQGFVLWDDPARSEGAVCYKGRAFLRPTWDRMEFIGKAHWLKKEEEDV
jgi:hypothetical protein